MRIKARKMVWAGGRLVIWLVLFCQSGWANLPLRNFWGEDVIKGQGDAILLNPALLGFVFQPKISFGLEAGFLTEERTRFVYDQFENTIGEAVIADNIGSSWVFGPLMVSYPWRRLVLGAGVTPVRDFRYVYFKEYRDDFYVKVGEDRLVQDGAIYRGDVRMAFLPWEFLSLGAQVGYLWGSRELSALTIQIPETTSYVVREKLGGVGWSIGAGWRPLKRLELDVSYRSGVKFPSNDTPSLRGLPWSGIVGLNYKAAGDLPSNVHLFAGIEGWQMIDSSLRNVFFVRMQVEHLMLNLVRLRYGLGWEPLFADVKVNRSTAMLGLSFDVGKWQVGVDGSFSREQLSAEHFFLPVVPEDVRVYANKFILKTSVGYGF